MIDLSFLLWHSAGKSSEGRDMHLVKISTGNSSQKKAIFVDGGIHAREWISPAFTTWLIHELVENYAAHPEYVDNVDWYAFGRCMQILFNASYITGTSCLSSTLMVTSTLSAT